MERSKLLKFSPLILFFLLILFSSLLPSSSLATSDSDNNIEEIPIYTYHTHPPFIVGSGKGLSYDLAAYFSEKSAGRFKFIVKPMSRPRVNKMIKEAVNGIAPWVNPVWFNDKDEIKHMWSKGFLMEDGNAVISRQDLRLVYEGPQSLDGKVLGGLRSHVYTNIDDYIKETGHIKRVDAENHIDNFRKLRKHRIDVTITPKSGAEYIIEKESLQKELFISPTPHSIYKRRVIIINNQQEVLSFIDDVIKDMPSDYQWKKIIRRYR